MDFHNTFLYHFVVASMSFLLGLVFYSAGIELGRVIAGVAFTLLFLTLIIGPLMRLWRPALEVLPWQLPWSWRGELGIWFTIISIIHMLYVFNGRQWDVAGYMAGMRLADLVAFTALFLALILAVTSLGPVIKFLGVVSWKWLHSFTYVVFYLVGAHVINHAFLRPDRPEDWLHWLYLIMILIVFILQFSAFVKTIAQSRKNLKSL
ncbi:MAG: hypothetical protein UV65_C0012G0018 [Parcubacteria group bacterium GW2011_GWF2_43_11]|nr:MAG: hypothetical protein UV65_C0012G0018 [Parcubacteria group bacterium GW2011_GWF2_43_11]